MLVGVVGVLEEKESGLAAAVVVLAVAVPWACWPAGPYVAEDLEEGEVIAFACGGGVGEVLGEGAVVVEGPVVAVPLACWPVGPADLEREERGDGLELEGLLLCCLLEARVAIGDLYGQVLLEGGGAVAAEGRVVAVHPAC